MMSDSSPVTTTTTFDTTESGTRVGQEATTEPAAFRKRNMVLLLPAMLSMYALYQGIQQVLLPAQVEAINPAEKVASLAILSAASSVAATIALPLGGAISDKTRSRFGRRAPWLAVAAVLAAGLTITMGLVTSIAALVVVYTALWFVMNWYQGVVYAIIPDRIPERLRGTASSLVGLALPLGILVSVNLVARTSQEVGYAILGIGLLLCTTILLFGAPDSATVAPVLTRRTQSLSGSWKTQLVRTFSAFRHRDFSLVFFSRIVFFFGVFAVSTFVFYILTDHIGMSTVPVASPAEAVSIIATLSTVAQVIAVLLLGPLADRLDRRKLIVGFSAIGMGVSFAIPLIAPSWGGMIGYAILFGASTGVYFAVDLALMSLVLPNKGDEGRDLGILAIATSVPSAFAPAVSALLLGVTGSYASLFFFGILAAALGAVLVLLVRSVR